MVERGRYFIKQEDVIHLKQTDDNEVKAEFRYNTNIYFKQDGYTGSYDIDSFFVIRIGFTVPKEIVQFYNSLCYHLANVGGLAFTSEFQ